MKNAVIGGFVAGTVILALSVVCIVIYIRGDSTVEEKSRQGVYKPLGSAIDKGDPRHRIVEDLKEHMNATADPCHDFYKFTCGTFMRNAKIPRDQNVIDVFSEMEDELQNTLKEMMNQPYDDSNPAEKFVKNFYKSCSDTDAIETESLAFLKKLLKEFKGWPLLGKKPDSSYNNYDVNTLLARLALYESFPLFELAFGSDISDSKVFSPWIYPARLMMSRTFYINNETKYLNALAEYMRGTALAINAKADRSVIDRDVQDMINFERELAKVSTPPEKFREIVPLSLKLNSLTMKTWIIRFDLIFKSYFANANIPSDPDQTVNVRSPAYHDTLETVVETVTRRTLINYCIWRFISSYSVAMPKKLRDLANKYNKIMTDVEDHKPRGWACLSLVSDNHPMELGYIYAKNFFNITSKKKVTALVEELRKSFHEMISGASWLSRETKALALEKLSLLRNLVGYPDWFDTKAPDAPEKAFERTDQYFESLLSLSTARAIENMQKTLKPADRKSSEMHIAIINAYYDPQLHSTVLPAGILRRPMFVDSAPSYTNFGGIGYIIGHEITHGYDDTGRRFDKDGNMNNWWKEQDESEFVDSSRCFVQQYSNFEMKAIQTKINGQLTLGENIADNGGLRMAYKAYKKWKEANGEEPQLPGLSYTNEQMFFISFGRIYCSKIKPSALMQQIQNSVHTPSRFRINGAVMNMEEFSEAFNCPSGSPMNPIKKCRVW